MEGRGSAGRVVTVFGGSGFLGRYLVGALARKGWRIRVAVRRPDRAFYLQPLGGVGQIAAIQANLRYPASVERALTGADAAVNLVGILAESRTQRFDSVHVGGAHAVAKAATAAGIGVLVHVSAIGADKRSASLYDVSKAEGETAVLTTLPAAVVMRPSIMFGEEDSFFRRFAEMALRAPVLPMVGGAARFQPVFVADVAAAIVRALDGSARGGTIYELGGPEILTFRQCLELMLSAIERRRLLLPIPFGVATALGAVLQRLPGKALTIDQVRQLRRDSVVSAAALAEGRTLPGLGITPGSPSALLPALLQRFRPGGQFAGLHI